ncbi:MAG: restriction endonuclease subunit S [Ignavibacteriae bacterium]|nr:restriction endonuclease subunit S [Ignavibacteriota bacterium]
MRDNALELVQKLKSSKDILMSKGIIPKKKDVPKLQKNDIPFEIPLNWVWERLSNVSLIQEGPGIRKHQYTESGIQFLTVTNILDGSLDMNKSKKYISLEEFKEKYSHFLLNMGDIVSSCSGATWGKTAIFNIDNDIMLNTSTLRLRFFNDLAENKYLYYLTKSDFFKAQLKKHQTGQQPNYGFYHYSLIATPIPPLPEQKQIVAILDKAFAAIDQAKTNIEKNIENAKELFQSKLNQIFSQKGEGWEEKTLKKKKKVCMCKRIMKHQTNPTGDIPFYKIGTFGKTPDAFITQELFQEFSTKYSYPKKGQILLSASGTIGRTVVFNGEPSFFQDSNIVWIDNNEELVLNDFLNHFYKVCDWNPSKGTTISRLYNDDLKRIKISIPSIEKQKILVPEIKKFEERITLLIKKYNQKLNNLEDLKKSILQKAFAGELTQKQLSV